MKHYYLLLFCSWGGGLALGYVLGNLFGPFGSFVRKLKKKGIHEVVIDPTPDPSGYCGVRLTLDNGKYLFFTKLEEPFNE